MKTEIGTSALGPASRESRSYSLIEASQLLGLSFAALHEQIVHGTLHVEAGPRGSRVSQQQLIRYVTRRETFPRSSANFFTEFGSNQ